MLLTESVLAMLVSVGSASEVLAVSMRDKTELAVATEVANGKALVSPAVSKEVFIF